MCPLPRRAELNVYDRMALCSLFSPVRRHIAWLKKHAVPLEGDAARTLTRSNIRIVGLQIVAADFYWSFMSSAPYVGHRLALNTLLGGR